MPQPKIFRYVAVFMWLYDKKLGLSNTVGTVLIRGEIKSPEVAYIKAYAPRILIHINCRELQRDIADDNRMMHRQIIRMLNIKYANLHFDSLFWTRQMPWRDFGDLLITGRFRSKLLVIHRGWATSLIFCWKNFSIKIL